MTWNSDNNLSYHCHPSHGDLAPLQHPRLGYLLWSGHRRLDEGQQISVEDGGVRYKRCTSDLNVVWRLYEVRASDGTIGYKTSPITILSRVDEHMDVEQR